MNKPNLFIIGAPKCGTTSMAAWLADHPDCYVSPRKEPHYFSNWLRNNMTLAQYEALFENAHEGHVARVDASTSYLGDREALRKILDYNPESRFLVMLRNPVDMAYALHGEVLWRGMENQKEFETAWRMQKERRRGKQVPISCSNPSMLLYFERCLLGRHLAEAMELIDSDRVHWIFLEDMKLDPSAVYREVLGFCGLVDDGRRQFAAHNRAKRHRLGAINRGMRVLARLRYQCGLPGIGLMRMLNRIGHMEYRRPPLHEEFRRELLEAFKDDVALLSNVTGRSFGGWRR